MITPTIGGTVDIIIMLEELFSFFEAAVGFGVAVFNDGLPVDDAVGFDVGVFVLNDGLTVGVVV